MIKTGLYKYSDASTEKYYRIEKLNLHPEFKDQYLVSWGGTTECSQGNRWFGREKTLTKMNEKTGKGYRLIKPSTEPVDPTPETLSTILSVYKWISMPLDQMIPKRDKSTILDKIKAKEPEILKPVAIKKSESDLFWDDLTKK